jgi:hypothetical protein
MNEISSSEQSSSARSTSGVMYLKNVVRHVTLINPGIVAPSGQ